MFEWVKTRVLGLMRVPHEPEPPLGAPGSVRVFRAGVNHYYLRVARWLVGQAGAVIGIGFSLVFLAALQDGVQRARRAAANPTPTPSPTATVEPTPRDQGENRPSRRPRTREERRRDQERAIAQLATRIPPYVMPLFVVLEVGGILFFIVQMLVTYAIVRLEFEQHWYIVTDRSLRIRTGILRLQESTMSFANVQQVEIRQGPLQRFLGLADVQVRSAGGGGDPTAQAHGGAAEVSLHVGTFEGVESAVEIRDLILERLRKFREAGLGDPEDVRAHPSAPAHPPAGAQDTAQAIATLLKETRALRHVLTRP
ncbi:MAG: PH domain-containing protein [Vicinamibacteria bacterium]|nr:PH domain-containing protein [Vicinamibacteria bacterium]